MFGFSIGEILFLGALGLIVIGPKQLPELARNLGRLLNELRRATEGFTSDLKNQARIDFDLQPPPRPPMPPTGPASPADNPAEFHTPVTSHPAPPSLDLSPMPPTPPAIPRKDEGSNS